MRCTPWLRLSSRQVTQADSSAPPPMKLPASASANVVALRSAGRFSSANCGLAAGGGTMSSTTVHDESRGRASTRRKRERSVPRTDARPSQKASRVCGSKGMSSGETARLSETRTACLWSGAIGAVDTTGEGLDHSVQPSMMGITLNEQPAGHSNGRRSRGTLICRSSTRHVSDPEGRYMTRHGPADRHGAASWLHPSAMLAELVAHASGGVRMRSAVVPVKNGPTSADGAEPPARLKAMSRKRYAWAESSWPSSTLVPVVC
mmetsp:Transcript_72/g.241  ORF Transcript_72/g.241 Transcript_72/m.241 type:complete len:262 (+) Transcript_72:705-1490(+)